MDHPRQMELDMLETALWSAINPYIKTKRLKVIDVILVLAKMIAVLSTPDD